MDLSNINKKLTSTEAENLGFIYEIRVDGECELFSKEPLKSSLQQVGEMTILSNWFPEHKECAQDAANIMHAFSRLLAVATGKKYIIATKINPLHDLDFNPETAVDQWDELTVMKMYVADSKILKKNNVIASHILGTVKAAAKINLEQAQALIPNSFKNQLGIVKLGFTLPIKYNKNRKIMSKTYPFQSKKQIDKAARFENYTSATGHVTIRRIKTNK